MKTFAHIAAVAALTAVLVESPALASDAAQPPAGASVEVKTGMQLFASDGHRIERVLYVSRQGNPQVVINGRLFTVPASTLSLVKGMLTTSLSHHEIYGGH